MNYIANNAPSIFGDQGDIVAIMDKMELIELVVIESIQNIIAINE